MRRGKRERVRPRGSEAKKLETWLSVTNAAHESKR